MLVEAVINAAVQVGLVLVIALVAWGIFARRRAGFLSWIGLTAPGWRAMAGALVAAILLMPLFGLAYLYDPLHALATSPNSVAGQIAPMGPTAQAALVIAVTAVFKTALAEEILFRGLIAKRLMNALGFQIGNLVQASLFTGLHLSFLLLPGAPPADAILIALLGCLIFPLSWVIGWLNERLGRGSILPGWLLHALSNLVFYPVLAVA